MPSSLRRTAPATGVRRDVIKLLICLAMVLVGGLGSYIVQTNAGTVQVQSLKIPGPNGQVISADLYKPVTASEDHKVPMVVVTPGFQRTKETQVSNSLELSRRGMATLVVDPYNQGESSSQAPDSKDSALIPAVDYVTKTSTFNYVDQDLSLIHI